MRYQFTAVDAAPFRQWNLSTRKPARWRRLLNATMPERRGVERCRMEKTGRLFRPTSMRYLAEPNVLRFFASTEAAFPSLTLLDFGLGNCQTCLSNWLDRRILLAIIPGATFQLASSLSLYPRLCKLLGLRPEIKTVRHFSSGHASNKT